MGSVAALEEGEKAEQNGSLPLRHSSSLELLVEFERIVSEILSSEITLAETDPHELERMSSQFALELERIVSLLRSLERLHSEGDPDDWNPDFAPDTMVTGLQTINPMLGDICFVSSLELGQACQALRAPSPADHRVVVLESTHRKLGRVFTAVLESARLLEDKLPDLEKRRKNDLDCGLAVRRVYSTFRRALRRPIDTTPESVAMALRYSGFALVTLFATPEFEKARVSDRKLLRHLQRRILAWARSAQETASGRELLEDAFTSADLLRGINHRQELQEHDRILLRELAKEAGDLDLHRLLPLLGLDDKLDGFIERSERTSEWGVDVRKRIEALCESLTK